MRTKNLEEWIETIKEQLNENNRIVLIAGASASGKSFIGEKLQEKLLQKGKRVALLSTDFFYKGLSRTITDKAELNHFDDNFKNKEKICEIIRDITISYAFNEKFREENKTAIIERLKVLFNSPEKLVKALEYETKNIDYDEPFSVDLKSCGEFISDLISNPEKKLIIPDYSMISSEVEYPEKNAIYGKDYDYIILEGIFALNENVLSHIKENTIKCFINSDINTLLVRRLNRDISKGRSSMNKQTVIHSYLTKICPAYLRYTYPDINLAEYILENNYTENEGKSLPQSNQQKYRINGDISEKLKKYEFMKNSHQIDHFLTKTNSTGVIRIRDEDGKVVDLTHKYETEDRGLNRPFECFSLRNELSQEYSEPRKFCKLFTDAGYKIEIKLQKDRNTYSFGDIIFRYDKVNGLGEFIEFTAGDEKIINQIKKDLNLEKAIPYSYYKLACKKLEKIKENKEKEIKVIINKVPQNYLSKHEITQRYVNLKNTECVNKIKKYFPNINIVQFDEARVREIDGKYILTLKDDNDLERKEEEKEISFEEANGILKHQIYGTIYKTRYVIYDDGKNKLEVDRYKNVNINGIPLTICECEFKGKTTEIEALNLMLSKLDKPIEYCAVTKNKDFKNKQISKKIYEQSADRINIISNHQMIIQK